MNRNFFRPALFIVLTSLALTLSSYAIVTGRNSKLDPLKEYVTVDGKHIVNLPCSTPDVSWESDKPTLPESRGIPVNYNFWNPCYGHKVLLSGLLVDFGFWLLVSSGVYFAYVTYTNRRKSKTHKTPTSTKKKS